MGGSPKLLVLGHAQAESAAATSALIDSLREAHGIEVLAVDNVETALQELHGEGICGLCLVGENLQERAIQSLLQQPDGILSQLTEGLAVLDPELTILWSNPRFQQLTRGEHESLAGQFFYQAFESPEILGPDYSPLHTALGQRTTAASLMRIGEKTYYQIQATPIFHGSESPSSLVVLLRDVSREIQQQQKVNAIYQAGLELGDLSPKELAEMSVQDRIELLKSKIVHFTKDLLQFETVEIRLLDPATLRLDPLLVVGMKPEAADRELFAKPQDNGVTGFVAATGKSYLCEDISHDPLYLPGAPEARSSLTVPLILHDEILGTFNVESTKPGAFTENDLRFLELFGREVAVALNTLDLLAAEKMVAATNSIDMILQEVAGPVDEILNEATWILERYIGHEPAMAERLQKILKLTREIKHTIHDVGETLAPENQNPALPQRPQRPKLRSKRVLVADNDETVRRAAHELLGRMSCDIETAHNGEEALLMVRQFDYDVVLVDIRLPDMTGYECFCQIKDIDSDLPVILMTGFGYDPGHSIVKARQQGLKAVLYKPFRIDQLFTEVEKAVAQPRTRVARPR
ncbi:MAG: response regulator [Planctomycetales bacterium]